MKGIFRTLSVGLSLLGAMASCSETDWMTDDGYCGETITATIVEPMDKAQSRTCIDMDNTGNGYLGILWQQNDSIGVFGDGSTRNSVFRNLASGNVATTDFSGTMNGGDKPWRAYYPYSSENAGADVTALKGEVPGIQPFDPENGKLTADYKYGAPAGSGNRFNFRHLFSLLRVSVDATSTPLENERLEAVELTVTDSDGNERPVSGSFTFSAVDGSWGNVTGSTGTVYMPWTSRPVLTTDTSYLGFITVMPSVKQGDKISVSVISEAHKATFSAICRVDFQAENIYNIPLTLKHYAENAGEFGYEVVELPVIKSFGFSVADNQGKILDNKLTWNGSNEPQFDKVSALDAAMDGSEISLMIPYLYDFTLAPDFTVTEGAVVTVDGVEQTSGKTQVDFSKPVTYTVTAGGMTRDYTVNISNTGLPVVVIDQSESGDFSEVKKGGFLSIGAKVVNKFVDFMIRGKDTEWVKDDRLTVYKPDGGIDLATANCGVRLRGNTSQEYPKKPFAVKFTSRQTVLGMPAHKRWVLLANWLDHSMIRNAVAFDVAHAIEKAWQSGGIGQGIPWNVHGQNVELVIDGHHVGNYYLCEQIKIDENRLDIQKPFEDVKSPTLESCGYLFELDNNYDETYKFITTHYSVPFMFKDALTDESIFNAVQAKIQGIEDNIYAGDFSTAYEDLDISSVIDQWLIWELTMNHEFLDPRSVYYFMDGNGKLSAGPVWDFDRATFQNVENAQSQGSSGDRLKPYDQWICWSADPKAGLSSSNLENGTSCVWYPELVTDPIFQAAVQERWAVVYPYLQGVIADIRNYGSAMASSYAVNNTMWPTTKAAIQKHKSNFSDWSGDENMDSYDEVIENFISVYQKRLEGMNALITSGRFVK